MYIHVCLSLHNYILPLITISIRINVYKYSDVLLTISVHMVRFLRHVIRPAGSVLNLPSTSGESQCQTTILLAKKCVSVSLWHEMAIKTP